MASLAKALKTDAMSDLDLKGLAQILRSRGRKGDTILAHISPREAALLKAHGGSGKINPETGLLEFAMEGVDEFYTPPAQLEPVTPPPTATETTSVAAPESVSPPQEFSGFGQTGQMQPSTTDYGTAYGAVNPQVNIPTTAPTTGAFAPTFAGADQTAAVSPDQQQNQTVEKGPPPSWLSRTQTSALNALQDPSNLLKLGLGAGGLGLGLSQQAAARRQANQTQAQYAALAAPFQQQGQSMISAAQRGELTPQSQQAYQAAQAQINQQVSNQGGVGAQQAATQLGNIYNTLLNNQMTLGMSTAQVGDAYAAQGIQAGLQANQQLQAMTSNYYSTLARMLVPSMASTATPARTQ